MKGSDIIKKLNKIMIFILLFVSIHIRGFAYGAQEQAITINNFPAHYKQYAYQKCSENGLTYEMFLAVAFNESRFTVDAVNINKNGTVDRGLCQINDSCIPFLKSKGVMIHKEQLFDPYINIDCYVELMKYHLENTGDEDLALLRYQVGEGAYRRIFFNRSNNRTYQTVLKYKQDFIDYLKSNPLEIIDLYSLKNYSYLCDDYPEYTTLINGRFQTYEWQGRYR